MKKLQISKESFCNICKMIQKQQQKDHEFASFMQNYLDGNLAPTISDDLYTVIEELMNVIFDDVEYDEFGYTWWTWFIYENQMGKQQMSVTHNKIVHVITSPEDFYEFMTIIS